MYTQHISLNDLNRWCLIFCISHTIIQQYEWLLLLRCLHENYRIGPVLLWFCHFLRRKLLVQLQNTLLSPPALPKRFYPEEVMGLKPKRKSKTREVRTGRTQHHWIPTLDGSALLQPNHLAVNAYLDFFTFHPLPDLFPSLGCYPSLNKCCQGADGLHSKMGKSQ